MYNIKNRLSMKFNPLKTIDTIYNHETYSCDCHENVPIFDLIQMQTGNHKCVHCKVI